MYDFYLGSDADIARDETKFLYKIYCADPAWRQQFGLTGIGEETS